MISNVSVLQAGRSPSAPDFEETASITRIYDTVESHRVTFVDMNPHIQLPSGEPEQRGFKLIKCGSRGSTYSY